MFIDKLKTIKNTIRFFYLFILLLKFWATNLKPLDLDFKLNFWPSNFVVLDLLTCFLAIITFYPIANTISSTTPLKMI